MRILLTGASGLLGRYTCRRLRQGGHQVTTSSRSNKLEADSILADLGDAAQVEALPSEFDCVVHLAARLPAPALPAEPEEWFHHNAQSTLNLLEHCARNGIGNFVYGSTWSVYGDSPSLPATEDLAPEPADFYSLSKLAGEIFAEPYAYCHGLSVKTLRFSYLYGIGMRGDTAIENFIRLARAGREIPLIHGGAEVTDLLYAQDAAAAVEAALEADAGTYNIGSGDPRTIREIAETIVRLTGSGSALLPGEPPRTPPRRRYLSTVLASRALKWKPGYTLEAGLADFIKSHGHA